MLEKHLYFMMGWRYLFNSDDRLVLWRNTIQLFYQYNKPKFVGPFKAAGFSYKVEPLFLSSETGDKLEPDIVSSGETGWLILELTTNPNKSKKFNLDRYKLIDPRDLSYSGLSTNYGEPDVISSRLSFLDDGPYCQITVDKILKIVKEDCLQNQHLKDELIKANGMDLRRLPEIPISILPEMMSFPKEFRPGLIELVLQIFDPNCDGKTAIQLVDDGLERLAGKIRPKIRNQLITKVNDAMDDLIKNHLSEYLEFKDNQYKATDKFKTHHGTMDNISLNLKNWAGLTPQTTLDKFTSANENEDYD